MQPTNATDRRSSVNTATMPLLLPGDLPTPESLGKQLRATLPSMRIHSISIYDDRANILWLSEGALGPDEHSAVTEAIDALSRDVTLGCHESRLEDGRAALVLPARSPQGTPVGLAMILADSKSIGDNVAERLSVAATRTILQKLAVLLRPASARTGTGRVLQLAVPINVPVLSPAAEPSAMDDEGGRSHEAAPVLSALDIHDVLEFEPSPEVAGVSTNMGATGSPPAASAKPAVSSAPAPAVTSSLAATPPPRPAAESPGTAAPLPVAVAPAAPAPAPAATDVTATAPAAPAPATTDVTATAPAPPAHGATGAGATTITRALGLPQGMSVTLEVHPFVHLRPGGRLRRFEVQPRISYRDGDRAPAGLDKYVLQQLLIWMEANRRSWSSEPTAFTLNLSVTSLEDERFPQFLSSHLRAHGISGESICFEITEAVCVQRRAQVERFFDLCEKLGCCVIIDDFSLDSSVVALLRSRALRLVKIDTRLSSVALKDKLAQAMVVAIAQAVKVLGIHCSAKRVDTAAAMQWLGAVGCDFAQGSAAGQPHPLDALLGRRSN